MPKFIAPTNESVNAVATAKSTKSVFQQSRFRDGMLLTITGYEFVVNAEKPSEKAYPTLTTAVGGQPFDNIWLSNLCRAQITADGADLIPEGALNKEAQRLMDDTTIPNDEEVLKRLVQFCQGKTVRVKREKPYKRMFSNGNIVASRLLEFELQLP